MSCSSVGLKPLYALVRHDVFMPKFATRFSCIGPDCRFNCCQYFTISFDQKYFARLASLCAPADKNKFRKSKKSKRSDQHFGEFVMDEQQACGFLEEGICRLHRDFGEHALSNPCYHFPRLFRAYRHDHTELILSMSCIEAARLALLEADAFDFVVQPCEVRAEVVENRQIQSSELAQLMFDVRFFCVQILQFKALAFWKRLAILGLFSVQLTSLLEQPQQNWQAEVQALIESTSAFIQADDVNDIYDAVCTDSEHLASCFLFLKKLQNEWFGQRSFLSLAEELEALAVGETLRIEGSNLSYDFEVLRQNYVQGCENLRQALADYPYFFEHLVLSHLLYLSFPFNQDKSLSADVLYRHLCFSFVFLRFALAIYCRDEVRSVDDLLMVVMKIMRALQHSNVDLLNDLMGIDRLAWDDFAVLYAGLKDNF